MYYQFEVTTHCNFQCFYCAGRDLAQRHMEWDLFARLLASIPAGRHEIALQGEGEPTAHPRFWDMVDAVRARGFVPYTITNASHVDVERFARAFPRVGVSLDTLDPLEAGRIGRHNLDRVIANIDALAERMGPRCIHVKAVDYGQALAPLADFVRARGLGDLAVQPLQGKHDYAQRYPERLESPPPRYTHRCRYLEQPLRRYYDVEGREYPCCFIKDPRLYEPAASLRAKMSAGEVPPACAGCREILAPESQPRVRSVGPDAAQPAVSFVTTCKGRLAHLKESLPRMSAQAGAETVVVDYDSPDGAGDWVAANFPGVRLVRVENAPRFNAARARNLGAQAARGRWLAFVDADVVLERDFMGRIEPLLRPGGYLTLAATGAEGFGSLVCERSDWVAIGGYDEVIEGWAGEDRDFYVRLDMLGRACRLLASDSARLIAHGDAERTRFHPARDRWANHRANVFYVQIKHDLARQFGRIGLAPEVRRGLYAEVQRAMQQAAASGRPGCRFEITLPAELVVRLFGGFTMRRVWTYYLDPPPQAAAAARGQNALGGAAG